MNANFRRSGKFVYQPICTGCRACVSLRVPVDPFQPTKSQRRCARKNADLTITSAAPIATEEKFELYKRYCMQWHNKPAAEAEDWDGFQSFLYDSPTDTLEFCYHDPAGRLLAVGICDICPQSLSSVYFYHDPAESRRSLGTFGALHEIETCRALNIPHYYLGFWIAGCGTMDYKANFRPCEVLGTDGKFRPLI